MFNKWIDFSWKTDAFIDTWSFVHFSWGIILGILIVYYGKLSFWQSILLAVSLMILWEIFEIFVGVGEKWTNVLSDILVGLIGFALAYIIIQNFSFLVNKILIITVIFMLITEYLGWTRLLK